MKKLAIISLILNNLIINLCAIEFPKGYVDEKMSCVKQTEEFYTRNEDNLTSSYNEQIVFLREHIGIKSGDIIFDVGANVGNFTQMYLQLGTKIICFEPQPDCIEILKNKFATNPNVFIEPVGLSNHEDTLPMHIRADSNLISTFSNDWMHGRFESQLWTKTITVPVSTLDKMIQKHGLPKFCKIDVEGHEYEVLQGLSKPIPCLSFEFVRERFDATQKIVNYLKNLGYNQFNFAIANNNTLICKEWLSADNFLQEMQSINALNTPNISNLWGDIYARIYNNN